MTTTTTTRRRSFGLLALVAYVLTVIAANYAIKHWGTAVAPGAPHTLPVGWGYRAPSGVYFVALALVLRDYVQWSWDGSTRTREWLTPGKGLALLGLAVGAGLSYLVADASIAKASALAFAASELIDFVLFTLTAPDHAGHPTRWGAAVWIGGAAGLVADTFIFLEVAFHSDAFWQGQILGKFYGVTAAALVIAARRGTGARRVVTA